MSYYCPECGEKVSQDDQVCSCCGVFFGEEFKPEFYTPSGVLDSHGRIGRLRYFLTQVFISLAAGILALILSPRSTATLTAFMIFIALPIAYLNLVAIIKRLQDLGHSALWAWPYFVPFVNFGLVVYLSLFKGKPGINEYGPPPSGIGLARNSQENKIAKKDTNRTLASFSGVFVSQSEKINSNSKKSSIEEGGFEKNIEDSIYEVIGKELDSDQKEISTWTRAYAEANGDEIQARVAYIKNRFDKLFSEHNQAVAIDSNLEINNSFCNKNSFIQNLSIDRCAIENLYKLKKSEKAKDFLDACKNRPLSIVRNFVLENPLYLIVDDSKGNTGLHVAILEGREDVAEFLLDNGASPIKENHNKKTPLMLAEAILPGISRLTAKLQTEVRKINSDQKVM